jgi:hypothetical protein
MAGRDAVDNRCRGRLGDNPARRGCNGTGVAPTISRLARRQGRGTPSVRALAHGRVGGALQLQFRH